MDIKSIQFSRLAAEVRACGVESQIVLASSRPEEIREWKALVPASETLLWMHGDTAALSAALAGLRATKFAGITQMQIHVYPKVTADAWAPPTDESPPDNPFRLPNVFLRRVGDELRAHGILFQAFPFTDAADVYARLLDLGVMSFATDHPDIARLAINAYYQARRSSR
jgi:hypothetical protein